MTSPVDCALLSHGPAPPPPLCKSSTARPFLRTTVVAAEPCVVPQSPATTSQSTRDGASPSWDALNKDSSDAFGTPQPPLSVLHLSAPHSPSLEVVPQQLPPPPTSSGVSLSGHQVLSMSGSRHTGPRREPVAALRSASLSAPAATGGASPLLALRPLPRSLARIGECGGEGAEEHGSASRHDGSSDSALVRSDSLPTSHSTAAAAASAGASLSPLRRQKSASPSLTTALAHSTTQRYGSSGQRQHLLEDAQPALPQRLYPTQLALFVDCMPSPNSASTTLTGIAAAGVDATCGLLSSSFGLSQAASSAEFSTTMRTWGCARGPHLNSAESVQLLRQLTPPLSCSHETGVASVAEAEAGGALSPSCASAAVARSPVLRRTTLAPSPPLTSSSASSQGKIRRHRGRRAVSPISLLAPAERPAE